MAEALKKVFTDKNAKVSLLSLRSLSLSFVRRPQKVVRREPPRENADFCSLHCVVRTQGLPAFVTFLTAGFPQLGSAVPLMLALQKGGADVIELGIPFSDPMADGVAIQHSNNVSSYPTRYMRSPV